MGESWQSALRKVWMEHYVKNRTIEPVSKNVEKSVSGNGINTKK